MIDLAAVIQAVLEDYKLPLRGIHGVAHWARVLENGLRLAETTGADLEVVRLFAALHDSRRVDDGWDPGHGPRAALFAKTLRGRVFEVSDEQFRLLQVACDGHTYERTHPDLTIQTCWDADRLDLGRVGIMPEADRLCTDEAKKPETILWADERASRHHVPPLVLEDWGIDL